MYYHKINDEGFRNEAKTNISLQEREGCDA